MRLALPQQPLLPVRRALQLELGWVPSAATVERWLTTGVRMPDGTRLRLKAWRVGGGHWRTSQAAAAEFARATVVETVVEAEAAAD
jgi:hypothetical protein